MVIQFPHFIFPLRIESSVMVLQTEQFLTWMVPWSRDYVTSDLLREILLLSGHSVKTHSWHRRKNVMLTRGGTRLSLTTAVCSPAPHDPSNHHRSSYLVPADGRTLKATINCKSYISLYFPCLDDSGQNSHFIHKTAQSSYIHLI